MTKFRMLDRRDAPGHEYGWFMAETDATEQPPRDEDRRTWLSVDLVAITDDPVDPALVLYRRERDPRAGELSLPGAVMNPAKGQTVAQTAGWIADERGHTAVVPGTEPHPISVVSDPDRDERGHTVSLVTVTRVSVPAPDSGAVLLHLEDPLPEKMPFGHATMLASAARREKVRLGHATMLAPAARRAFDGLFDDAAIAHALVSTAPAHGVTRNGLYWTLRLLHHLAGGDPAQAPTLEAVRRRRSRSAVLVSAGTVPATTRPETVYVSG